MRTRAAGVAIRWSNGLPTLDRFAPLAMLGFEVSASIAGSTAALLKHTHRAEAAVATARNDDVVMENNPEPVEGVANDLRHLYVGF